MRDSLVAGAPGYSWQNIAPNVLNLSCSDSPPSLPSSAGHVGNASAALAPLFAPDPLCLSLGGQPGQTQDASCSPAALFPSVLHQLKGCQSICSGPSAVVDSAQWKADAREGPFLPTELMSDGYNNGLGLNTGGLSVNSASVAALLGGGDGQNTLPDPLGPADFVTLGHLTQTADLKFFQMARAASGQDSAGLDEDSEGQSCNQFTSTVVALGNLDTPYLFASIRDQWGLQTGQYNTVVIALNFGQVNPPALYATPEPSLCLILGGFMAGALVAKRRLDRRADVTAV